mmetsp:Transcript_50110/g.108874  ORF Transcript_50110/g.108874 Transcript_50110/m.108874 type:complete len:82 (+) Transcript_50110:272-517(+)
MQRLHLERARCSQSAKLFVMRVSHCGQDAPTTWIWGCGAVREEEQHAKDNLPMAGATWGTMKTSILAKNTANSIPQQIAGT